MLLATAILLTILGCVAAYRGRETALLACAVLTAFVLGLSLAPNQEYSVWTYLALAPFVLAYLIAGKVMEKP